VNFGVTRMAPVLVDDEPCRKEHAEGAHDGLANQSTGADAGHTMRFRHHKRERANYQALARGRSSARSPGCPAYARIDGEEQKTHADPNCRPNRSGIARARFCATKK